MYIYFVLLRFNFLAIRLIKLCISGEHQLRGYSNHKEAWRIPKGFLSRRRVGYVEIFLPWLIKLLGFVRTLSFFLSSKINIICFSFSNSTLEALQTTKSIEAALFLKKYVSHVIDHVTTNCTKKYLSNDDFILELTCLILLY